MYCTQCGSILKEDQTQCPNCGKTVGASRSDGNIAVAKKNHKSGIMLGIIAIILIISIISVSITIAIVSRKRESVQLRKSYATFVYHDVVENVGDFSQKKAKDSGEGLYSVVLKDLDKDKKNECIATYKKKKGKKLALNIACYKNSKNNNNVQLTDTVTAYESINYADSKENSSGELHFNQMYYVQYNDKVYFFEEHVSAYEGFDFYVNVYEVQNGKFNEVGSLYYTDNHNAVGSMVTCPVLPDELKVDNSKIDKKLAEESQAKEAIDKGEVLLYFRSEMSEFEYKEYDDEFKAISAFYQCFGVEREKPVLADKELELTTPSDVEMIYSIECLPQENGDDIDCEFKDYTDSQSFISEADVSETTTAKPDSTPDFNAIIKNAAQVSHDIIQKKDLDESQSFNVNDYQYSKVKLEGIKTWRDYKNYLCKSFTSESVDELGKGFDSGEYYIERDDGLYIINNPGQGEIVRIQNTEFICEKVSDTEYNLKCLIFFNGDTLAPYETELKLVYNDGVWQFDNLLDDGVIQGFDVIMADETEKVEKARTAFSCFNALSEAMDKWINDESVGSAHSFGLYDIDRDGTDELVVFCGDSYATMHFEVYTFSNGEAQYLGTVLSYTPEFQTDGKKTYIASFHNGIFFINEISVVNGNIESEEIFRQYDYELDNPENMDDFIEQKMSEYTSWRAPYEFKDEDYEQQQKEIDKFINDMLEGI